MEPNSSVPPSLTQDHGRSYLSTTEDGNEKGDNLGVGDGPGGQDDLELDDVLRACYRNDCFRVQVA